MDKRATYPIQKSLCKEQSNVCAGIYLAAYEVYEEIYGSQESLLTGRCRGGFCPSELVAFLYARSFPRKEWRQKVNEAFAGQDNM